MQKARRHPSKGLRPLVSARFQVLFHPVIHGTFHLPSRYLFAIGLSVVFSLTRWCWQIHTGFPQSRATQDTDTNQFIVVYRILTFFDLLSQNNSTNESPSISQSYNPNLA